MQPHPQNPIELKKKQTRDNARKAVVSVGGGVVLGGVLGFAASSAGLFVFFLVLGLIGGVYYGTKVRRAIATDPSSPY